SFNAALPRTGRLQRQIARAFVANEFRLPMTGDFSAWCYPGQTWKHWRNLRRALSGIAKPIDRCLSKQGKPLVWLPAVTDLGGYRWPNPIPVDRAVLRKVLRAELGESFIGFYREAAE